VYWYLSLSRDFKCLPSDIDEEDFFLLLDYMVVSQKTAEDEDKVVCIDEVM